MRRIVAALLLLWLIPSAPAAAAIGTPVLLGAIGNASANQLQITSTAAAVSAHDLIIIYWYSNQSTQTVSSVTDTASNTYVQGLCTGACATNKAQGVIYVKDAAAMASGSNVTVNFTVTNRVGILVIDVPGGTLTLGDPYDYRSSPLATASAFTGTSPSPTQTTLPLSSNSSILFCFAAWGSSPGTITAPGGSWSASLTNLATNVWFQAWYQIVASTASVTCGTSWVNSIPSRTYIAVFKGAQASNTSRQTQEGLLGVGQ